MPEGIAPARVDAGAPGAAAQHAPVFRRLALVGVGLIGSSVARVNQRGRPLAAEVVAHARSAATLRRVEELGIADLVEPDLGRAVEGADCVMLCAPVGAYAGIAAAMAPVVAAPAIQLCRASRKIAAIMKPLMMATAARTRVIDRVSFFTAFR